METLHKWLQTIICLVILILVSYFIFFNPHQRGINDLKEYWENKNFKTDTTKIKVDYSKIPKPEFKYTVPPAQVNNYYNQPPTNKISVSLNDSLITVIDSLKKHITLINSNYIKRFPEESKILYGLFTQDSLRLDLLHIDGNIRTERYGVNYNRFKYQYLHGKLEADPISNKVKPFTILLYGYGGYDFISGKPVIGGDYSLYKNNWRLTGNSFLSIDKNPTLTLQGTIGYRIR